MKPPAEVHLSREDGEALRTRLAEDALTAADRRVLDCTSRTPSHKMLNLLVFSFLYHIVLKNN